jgi:hypothetical protein
MARRRKTKGGGWFGPDAPVDPNARTWSQWAAENTPSVFKNKQAPLSQALPAPVQGAVLEGQQIGGRVGKRLSRHIGYNISSGKSMRKLLGTAKDNMLGRRRRRRTHRR